MRLGQSLFLGTVAWAAVGAEFHVSPGGSPAGDGSEGRPWDLQTALHHPPAVKPGDTIWLRDGLHRQANHPTKFMSRMAGSPGRPITVRQHPGERATIDGNITQAVGGWVNYWGFEIMNSHPTRLTDQRGPFPTDFWVTQEGKTVDVNVSGFDLRAPQIKLINLVIHDSIGGGIGVSTAAHNPELYGVLSYYNGWQGGDRGHGHGLYAQSLAPSSPRVAECIFFGNYGLGVQATGSEAVVDNFHFEGNVMFRNGVLARQHQANFLLGPYTGAARSPSIIRNFIYDTEGSNSDANIGYTGGALNPVVRDNCFPTSVLFSPANRNLVLTGNTFLSNTFNLVRGDYPDNTYLPGPTTAANLVEIRPNRYEVGRAHIVVYNWRKLATLPVDVGRVLPVGTAFEVHHAQDFFGAPVLSGVHSGGLLSLPMTNLSVAKPIATDPPPSSAPEFNVFILLPRGGSTQKPNRVRDGP